MDVSLPPAPTGHPVLKHAIPFARDPFDFVDRATTECGDIYRMELPLVDDVFVLAHPEYFNRVLVTDIDNFGKTPDYRRAFGNGLLSTEGQQWREQRNHLQPLFYRDHIRGYADRMVDCTERRLAAWNDGEIKEMETEMRDLTLEILFATLFGRELAPGADQELRAAADGLNDWFTPSSWILPDWMPTPARRRFANSKTRLRQEVQTLLADENDSTIQSSPTQQETPDLLTQLQHARNAADDSQLSTTEIEDQLITMVFAGHDTTATALAFTWYALATNPDLQDTFHHELETVLGDTPPTYEDLQELAFTDQLITEALRLYPSIHTIPRQTETDVEINGYRLPEGHEIHLSIIHVHRDSQFYANPLEFHPERWTDGFEDKLPRFAYTPFGGGRRSCIGREFALLEAKIVLATVGQQFEVVWESDDDIELAPLVTTGTRNGIPVRLKERS